jgi:hypothetical protein
MTQEEFLLQIAEFLESVGIPFMVAGSHSSSVHSQPRTTNDVDLVIEPTQEALSRRTMFNVIDFDNGWKADLIVRKNRPFSIEEFSRRQLRTIHGRTLPIASPEDVILSKLEWNKIAPSERQVRDALNVAAVQWSTLDQAYLRKWAAELGVSEKLDEVLRAAKEQQPS